MSEHSVETERATVDEAVTAALAELGASQDAAEIEVLAEGRRGLFGGRKSSGSCHPQRSDQQGTRGRAGPHRSRQHGGAGAGSVPDARGGARVR